MNTDIRLQVNWNRHPKVIKLKRRLGADGVLGLITLWTFVGQSKPDGRLTGMEVDDIAIAADYPGDESEFLETLIELRLVDRCDDGTLAIHDWKENNPWAHGHDTRQERARKAAEARWGKKEDAESMHEQCSSNACAMPKHQNRNAPSPSPTPFPKQHPPNPPSCIEQCSEHESIVVASCADALVENLVAVVAEPHRAKKSVVREIDKALEGGITPEQVRRNIEYTNRNCKSNYGAYLAKAIREDFGQAVEEQEQTARLSREEQKRREAEEDLRRREEEERFRLATEKFEALRENERQELIDQVIRGSPMLRVLGKASLRTMAINQLCERSREISA